MSDYRALYRKWRPVDFDDVCGQKATTDILKYEVENGKLSHAYLFCGSRGTGKTSCAKILAKAVNCLSPRGGNPCNSCDACRRIDLGIATDVIEMDAASNNGVNDVRDMKDEIAFTPAELKYRVYIIDEVHMMSPSAFNALLKTLEEPPEYVVFILATTEFHKLPTTIVSRCQRFDFRRITTDVIISRLEKIASAESIDLTKDGAAMIARASEGGMRDAVSLLELCAGAGAKVDENRVYEVVGRGDRSAVYGLVEDLAKGKVGSAYSSLANAVLMGVDLGVFWQELIDSYRDVLVVKNYADALRYLDLTDSEYAKLKSIADSCTATKLLYHASVLEGAVADLARAKESKRSIAEIALTKMCDPRLEATAESMLLRIEELESTVSKLKYGAIPIQAQTQSATETSKATARQSDNDSAMTSAAESEATDAAAPSRSEPYSNWGKVVKRVQEIKASLYSPLAKATAVKNSDGSITVKVDKFFADIISGSNENMAIIKGLIGDCEEDPANIRVSVLPKGQNDMPTISDELEIALNQ